MSQAGVPARRDLEDKIVARAWADEGFRERLKADPHGAVAEETGITVPESIKIEVLEETPEKGYLVIPVNRAEMSVEQLEAASGGTTCTCTGHELQDAYGG
jgi:Nitrile hydratase, alpha chain